MSATEKPSAIPYDTMSIKPEPEQSFMGKCCFCIPLRAGCLFLGYLSLVFSIHETLTNINACYYIFKETNHFVSDQSVIINYKEFLDKLGVLLVVLLIANVIWLLINAACLVGLHKKRPGPIKVYVSFASGRLLISLAYFIYLTVNTKTFYTDCFIDFSLSVYFILAYYIYAAKLDRQQTQSRQERFANNIAFIYPQTMDKKTLVA